MAENGQNGMDTNEMMKVILAQLGTINEEIARMKADRSSTSREHVAQHPSVIPPPPPMARPAVLNVEDDIEDEQYAEHNCLPHLERDNEGRAMADRIDKLAQEMENIKFQGPKKLNMADFMIYPGVTLPPRFKVPDMDRYDGTGCPRSHLMSVLPLLQQHGLSPEQVALLFPRSLVGVAKKWFLSLKSEEIRTLEDIANRFVEQFSMEEGIDNLSPQYYHHMAIQYFLDFNHLIKTGTQIEDALSKGLRSRVPSDSREGKRPMVAPKEVHSMNTAPPARRVNFGEGRPERKEPNRFDPLPYSLSVALKKLLRDKKIELLEPREAPNPLPRYWRKDYYCEYHQGVGHLTDRCMALKHKIQDMIEAKKFFVEAPNVTRNPLPTHATPPPNVYALLTKEVVLDYSRICAVISEEPYVLRWEEGDSDAEDKKPYVLSARDGGSAESAECSYVLKFEEGESSEEVPYVLRLEDEDLSLLNDQCDELRHVTRGGRVFKPAELRVENPAEVARGVDHQNQKQKQSLDDEEDNLLKQLKKTQANVSIWGLLMASPKHRQVVLRELNSSQVSVEITPDELVSLVAATRASRDLSFTDEDLPPEGRDHVRPLRITIICNKKRVPEVLIDNGSALNVCPLSTATTLGFEPTDFIPSEQGILAYDGTRRDVIGILATEIEIRGETFEVEFQKLKFIRNSRVITVRGDPEPEIGQITAESVDESAKDVSLTGFSLEVSTITIKEAMNEEIMFLSSTNVSVARMMRRFGYIPGAGLGRNLQGLTEWPLMKAINGLFGLGYQPTRKEVQEMKAYMLKWANCRRQGLEFPMGPFSMIMNGRFRKEGADCPFYGFSEPWYDEAGKKLPGLEIFFADELPKNFFFEQIAKTAESEKQDSDWVENFESESLDSLFQVEALAVAMIGGDAPFINPRSSITPAEGPLDNWTSQVL
ncbi:uncharacterized protein LOC143850601 [Tasmannia lanceolata]|uniref:uncharacterized protein LOC143850601 n=1 Tax=Tasmannia lanceolata TaxID=3420 RepID=UPI004064499D